MIQIQIGALFIGDAHWGPTRPGLMIFLEKIAVGEIKAPQLFLMGDMADLLIGPLPVLKELNTPLLEALKRAAQKTEIFYFEGNHDFLLSDLLPDLLLVPVAKQPLMLACSNKNIALAHGDWDGPWHYRLFSNLLRRPVMLGVLHLLTGNFINEWFVKWQWRRQQKKVLCRPYGKFPAIVAKKMARPFYRTADVVIEGHFHQDYRLYFGRRLYINLPAFGCTGEGVKARVEEDNVFFEKVMLV